MLVATCQQAWDNECEHILSTSWSCCSRLATSLLQVCYKLCVFTYVVDKLFVFACVPCVHWMHARDTTHMHAELVAQCRAVQRQRTGRGFDSCRREQVGNLSTLTENGGSFPLSCHFCAEQQKYKLSEIILTVYYQIWLPNSRLTYWGGPTVSEKLKLVEIGVVNELISSGETWSKMAYFCIWCQLQDFANGY